jgi:endonuclease I
MPTGEPPFFSCSYLPIKRKSVACLKVLVFKGSPEVQENPWALGLKSLNRTHLYMKLPYNIRTSERTLSVFIFIGQITVSNRAYKKSPRAEGVRL